MRNKVAMALFIVALVALAIIVFMFLRRSGTEPQPTNIERFAPSEENDKVIFVKGWSEEELHKIVDDFVEIYKRDSYPAYSIEIHKQGENFYRLTFPQDIHPRLFTFLVNYIVYPFDLDFRNRSIIVGGKTTLDSAFDGVDKSLFGQKAILYIPENDKDNATVYMQTESGINLANSFTDLIWRRVSDARFPNEVKRLMEGV
jgi:hypothetical protein